MKMGTTLGDEGNVGAAATPQQAPLLKVSVYVVGGDEQKVIDDVPKGSTLNDVLIKGGIDPKGYEKVRFNGVDRRLTDQINEDGNLMITRRIEGGS